jgi:catechol 2,3-dioxygenase-like lactoylglutathione lyase family enzyme
MPELTHGALCTKNNRRLARFYQTVFGWEEVWNEVQNSPYSVYIGDGYFQLNCLQIRSGSGRVKFIDGKEVFPPVGINHLGFQIADTAMVEDIGKKLASVDPSTEMEKSRPDGRYEEFRFDDIEGNPLELSRIGWPAGDGKNAIMIRHVGIGAKDPVRVADYYKLLFSMKEVRHERNDAIELSDGFFNLSIVKSSPENKQGIHALGFKVPSVDAIEDTVKKTMRKYTYPGEAPIQLHREALEGSGKAVWLNDPDGNRVELSEAGWQV